MSLLSWLRHKGYPDDLYLNPFQVCREEQPRPSLATQSLPATPHRPDSELLGTSHGPGGVLPHPFWPERAEKDYTLCHIEGCDGTATRIVARSLRHKEVCWKCSDELVAVFGWELVGRI